MSTMADAEGSILAGQARFLAWLEAFTAQWDAPLTDTLSGVMWNSLGPDVRDQVRQMTPQAAGVMDQNFGGGINGSQMGNQNNRVIFQTQGGGVQTPTAAATGGLTTPTGPG